jgi:hypothetical protein
MDILTKVQELPEDLIEVIKGYTVEHPWKTLIRNYYILRAKREEACSRYHLYLGADKKQTYEVELSDEEWFELAKRYLNVKLTSKSIIVYGACFADKTCRFSLTKDRKRFNKHVRSEVFLVWHTRFCKVSDRMFLKLRYMFKESFPSRNFFDNFVYKHTAEALIEELLL